MARVISDFVHPKKLGLWSGFCLELVSPILFTRKLLQLQHDPALDSCADVIAMRSDWERIGESFDAVISLHPLAEHGKKNPPKSVPSQPPLTPEHDDTLLLVGSAGQAREVFWKAPLHPPSLLRNYDALVPGSAQTMFNMVKQQDHRIAKEPKLVVNQRIGMGLGAFIVLIAIGGAIYLAQSTPWVALALLSMPVLWFVNVIVSGGGTWLINPRTCAQQKEELKRTDCHFFPML
ncbi:MAG: hypothetical protein ORN21_01335 [Methylophilaceae bacterium]|nr:hypothetical protein [Methylophilaceae bacterium]